MRYLFLVMAAALMVGCGKSNPVTVIQKEYYFSGETLIKVNFKDLKMENAKFDGLRGDFVAEYFSPMPSDLDLTYIVSIPYTRINAYDPSAAYPRMVPVFFIANMDSTFNLGGGVQLTQDNKYLLCRVGVPCDAAKWNTDSVQIIQRIKDIMDKSWMTYLIQKAVDLDS